MRTNELMLYKHMENGQILQDITFLIENYQNDYYNMEDMKGLLYDAVNEILEMAVSHGFEGDLWHNYLTYLMASHENAYSTKNLRIGYFGASTGAAAAIQSAAGNADIVKAIVSRGGRPDLAMPYLEKITAPTLLIVGGNDEIVIELNIEAYNNLQCERKLEIVEGATHLFEEPGTLEQVAILAEKWFEKYLVC